MDNPSLVDLLFKFGDSGLTLLVLGFMTNWFMRKLNEKDAQIERQNENIIEAMNHSTRAIERLEATLNPRRKNTD
jgi:hypothetical protein